MSFADDRRQALMDPGHEERSDVMHSENGPHDASHSIRIDGSVMARVVHVMTVPQSLYTFLRGQVPYVQARGFEIHGVASPGGYLQRFAERDGVAVHAVEMPRRITPFGDLQAIVRLLGLLRRLRPEIVQAGTPKGGLLGMIAAWLGRVPVRIYHIRGLPFMTATGRKRTLLWWTERVSCRLAHRVLCVSHSIREVAIAEGLCPAEKIVVLRGGSGNGVDAAGRFSPATVDPDARRAMRQRYGIPLEVPVVGFLGRLIRDKGVVELAEAWTLLRDEWPDAHLLIAGPFEPQDPVPAESQERLRADPRVHLAGSVDDAVPFYAAIDLLTLPTYREGLPNVLLEAAAMERPVVATQVPGCVDVVEEGVTGMLVPVQDAVALAAAIRGYLADPDLRRRHGEAGRQWVVRKFRQEAIWEALVQEYGRLLRERGLPVPPAMTITGRRKMQDGVHPSAIAHAEEHVDGNAVELARLV